MEQLLDLPNITFDYIIEEESNQKQQFKSSNFDVKNYLNVKLEPGETEKSLTIRLLPMDLKTGNPFVKVHVHNVKVPKELSSGANNYKGFICLQKNKDIDHTKFGNKCPFCELNRVAYEESTKTTDETKKKELQKLSLSNLAQEAVIVRCIERGKEDDGVKFWKFNIRQDKTDPYNQILNLHALRREAGERKGKVVNTLDIYNGRDLTITISEKGTSAPTIIDDSDNSPLSEDENKMREWIFDPKKWQDVFTCKPYEYLELVSQMKIPWFDRELQKWVDKNEYDIRHNNKKKESDDNIHKAERNIVNMIGDNHGDGDDEDIPF